MLGITTETVLILGAGASNDFGFPLGTELKEKVVGTLSTGEFRRNLTRDYGFRPGIPDLIDKFIADLQKDRALTIDRFLAKSTDEYKTLGKVAIAKTILESENDSQIFQAAGSWYKVLYGLMNYRYPDLNGFGSNKISIITFNYDRSIEHFFYEQLCGDYHEPRKEEIVAQLNKIPILHLHGRVNKLPWEDTGRGLPYGVKGFAPNIFEIAGQMLLPGDQNNILKEAHSLIDKAERIYFLGFGFDTSNLSKLDINLISKCDNVFATSHGLPVAQHELINRNFAKETIKFYSAKVYDFFMKHFTPNRKQPEPNIRFI